MNPRIMKALSFLVLTFLLIASDVVAKGKEGSVKKVKGAEEILGSPSRTRLNINSISTWIYNNGDSDIKPDGNSGFIFPKGSNKAAVFESGFVWGATIKGEKKVGGSTYKQGLLPGAIINGGREDEDAAHVRIYRVRKDFAKEDADFSSEINDGEGSEDEIYQQYQLDWDNWPAEFGAPFEDINGNGIYEPSEDIPGVAGADQTIWFVANDLDTATSKSLYGSTPMGVEMQATFWGYNQTGALGNMIFRKYVIINKTEEAFGEAQTFDSMYVSMWSDPDVGDAADDFSGADVDLSLMFTYNGDAEDGTYGFTPPAVGFDFFQGPIVPAPGETAIYNGKYKKDYKNLPMSAHYFFINGDPVYSDPDLGEYVTGTLQFHNLFEGKISTTGAPFVDPTTGLVTKFTLSGDPVMNTGWVDGMLHPQGDRRQGMVAGPFNMAAGDTQEVVIGQIVAGAFENVDRLGAVQLLKFYDLVAQNTYDNFFNVPDPVGKPVVDITELENEVVLKWNADPNVEEYSSNGYEFQGYVVYQFPLKASSFNDAKVVATYDIKDGIGSVFGPAFDTESGSVLVKLLKKGPDIGLTRYISLKKDIFKSGAKLNNGTPYYFAVTSYAVNPNDLTVVPTILESSPITLEVIPQSSKPGFSDPIPVSSDIETVHDGTADAIALVKVVDPMQTSGDDYEVFFNEAHYYLGADGQWHETNYPDSIGKSLGKDVSPAYLTGISFIASTTTRDLKFTLKDLEAAPDYSYADGIQLTFPAGIEILSAEPSGTGGPVPGIIAGQTVTWGAEDTTQNGPFHGGEVLTVTVSTPILPLDVDYIIWDDGWGWLSGPAYGINGEYKHAFGTVTVSNTTNYFRTENHWNVRNTTNNELVLVDQRILNGYNIYASFWNIYDYVGDDAAIIFDGLQVVINGSYAAPVQLGKADYKRTASQNTGGEYKITDYGIQGWAASGRSVDAFGNGTTSIDELQKDYELRYTGEYVDPSASVRVIKDGTGSMATIYGARGYDLKDHPMNPNPGSDDPFLIRIPFEIWNVDDDRQINILIYDRNQTPTDDPFFAFNPNLNNDEGYGARMYCEINNTPYAADVVNSADPTNSDTDNLTWNLVVRGNNWTKGDVVLLSYDNPIQLGKDKMTFGTEGIMYSGDNAKIDIKKINVFPNPYYGVNPNEINKYQRYVTFNHLPPKATIRVFNLAGQLVKTVEKEDNTQFARWTLTNESELPVASGIYIVYIDMPDLGETKVLKVAVIQETQILDRY